MARRIDDSYLSGQAGGSPPAHEELEIEGPFGGFQTDLDPIHNPPPQIASDINNLDVLNGDMVLRPGSRELFDPEPFASTVDYFKAINRVYDGVSEPPSDTKTLSRWAFFLWGQYNFWFPDSVVRFGAPPGLSGPWTTINSVLPSAGVTVDVAGSSVTLAAGGPTGWEDYRLLGTTAGGFTNAFFKVATDPDTAWTRINGADPTVISLVSGYLGPEPVVGVDFLIAIPILDGSYPFTTPEASATGSTKIPLSDPAEYYISGWPGGTIVDSLGTAAGPYQDASDPIKYRANASIIKAGRLMIATDLSYERELGGLPGTRTINDILLQPTSHPGRIAWTRTNNIRSFDFSAATGGDPTAGFIDDIGVAIGSIHDLFEMRGVTYALSEQGIAAINETGNAYDPFRIRIIVNNKVITPRSKAQVVDGRNAYFMSTDGLYAFDGGSITAVSIPVNELLRGEYGIRDSVELATKGALHYDDVRNRLYVLAEGAASRYLVYDIEGGYWLKHTVAAALSQRFAVGLNWPNSAVGAGGSIRQDSEMVVIGRGIGGGLNDKLYSYERSVATDAGEDMGWSWFSPTITFGETRSVKTVTRFRVIVQDVNATAALPILIEWYTDGGTTPVFSKVFDIGSNPTAGLEYEKFVTFPGITGTKFRFRLSSTLGDVHIKKMAITFKRRLEKRQM
ncbi:MAG TPA: hypothetical protein VNA25_29410 [Phycisphaerae bacterium]|nr:hypothetical protein [Phycisphaerae bacterium]